MKHGSDTLDLLLWIIVLIVQSLPYLAALLLSLVSGLPRISAKPIMTHLLADAGKDPAAVNGHTGLPTAHQK